MAYPTVRVFAYSPSVMEDGAESAAVVFQITDLSDSGTELQVSVAVYPPTGSADRDIYQASLELKRRLESLASSLGSSAHS